MGLCEWMYQMFGGECGCEKCGVWCGCEKRVKQWVVMGLWCGELFGEVFLDVGFGLEKYGLDSDVVEVVQEDGCVGYVFDVFGEWVVFGVQVVDSLFDGGVEEFDDDDEEE